MTRTTWGLDSDPDEDWRVDAACRGHDPEIWTLQGGAPNADYELAHQICAICPVKQPCLELGLRMQSVGVILGGRDFGKRQKGKAA